MLLQPLAMAAGEKSDFAIQAMQADALPDSMTAAAEGQAYKCSRTKGCELGCCRLDDKGDSGNCGAGPEFCGKENCHSECSWKSECDPGWGIQWSNMSSCPLNVCCSE